LGKTRTTGGGSLTRVWPIWGTTLCGAILLPLLSALQNQLIGIHSLPLRAFLVPMVFGSGAGFLLGFLGRRQEKIFQEHLASRELVRAELELRERRFRLLAENAKDIIFRYLLDERRYDYVSPAVEGITGRPSQEFYADPDLLNMIVIPEDQPIVKRVGDQTRQGILESPVEFRILHRDGHHVWLNQRHTLVLDEEGRPVSLEGIITDITDQRLAHLEKQELEMRLLHSQKLEAMGKLVSGIAHDFNNLLTVINGYSEMLLNEISREDDSYFELKEIRRAGGTASELTQQLLTFGSKKESQARVLQPEKAARETLRMLRRLVGEDIQLHTEVAGDLPTIFFAQVQFDQILMNLLLNARDAMPRGGHIHIRLGEHHAAGITCSHCDRVIQGRFLEMRVTDDGVGMSPEVCRNIFHPFYSTKETTQGRGLGLATVSSIITKHDGHILVESEPDAGTTFTILLPAHHEGLQADESPRAPDLDLLRGEETLLVVEDEEQVRQLTTKILRGHGYTVLSAVNAEDGRQQFQETAESIDLVLTDVVMPGESGVELALGLLARKPELPVIFMSGYVKEKAAVASIDKLGRPLLRKPFATPALLKAIRQALDETAPDD